MARDETISIPPGDVSRLSELDQWRGEDIYPFGGVA